MGVDDKAKNTADKIKGKAKEGTGAATGDEDLRDKGRAEQTEADAKQAGEKVKDAFKN
jgi:uncharacterized protein YjbJ (UPF0337 family)